MESSKRRSILKYAVTPQGLHCRIVEHHGEETSKSHQRNANKFIKALIRGQVVIKKSINNL